MKHLFKKNLLKLSAAFLLFAVYILISCAKEDLKPLVDYRCQVTMSSSSKGKVYANIPDKIDLNVKKKDDEIGKYSFSFTQVEGAGDVIVNNHPLKAGEDFPVDISDLSLSYIPTKLGTHKLKFSFRNEEYVTESVYALTANELAFEASAENLPKKLLIEKPFAFDLNLSQKTEAGQASEFNTLIEVVKGKGYVSLVGSDSSFASLKATLAVDSLSTRAGSNEYKVKLGNNKLHYQSLESGENVLLLRVQNEYGYTQDLNVPLNIQLPEFAIHIDAEPIANVGTINNFLLNIEDVDNFGQNEYTVTYRNIKNSGILKINNNELQVGSTLVLKKGDNVCEFIPKELGEASLEFIVKDKYNTTLKDTAEFSVARSYVKINISNYDSTATIYDTRDINFSVNKTNYTGKYYFDLQQSPLGFASVKINGADYAGGRMDISNPHNTLVSFVPKNVGDFKMILKVYDDYDSESSDTLHFNITNSAGKINISNYNPSLSVFNGTSLNFSVNKPNYNGKFQFEIIQQSANLIAGNYGKLKVNGAEYSGGRIDITNINNTSVNFVPEKVGDMNLLLKVYDDFGGIIEEPLSFSINNTNIKVFTTDLTRDLILGKEVSFSVTASKPYYEGALSYTVSSEQPGAGSIKINGNTYLPGTIKTIQNNTNEKISFLPFVEGTISLEIKVSDDWGQTTTYPIIFNVTNPPIRSEITGYVPAITYNTENIFNLSVAKDNYSGDYQYRLITTPANSGKIKVNGKDYEGGIFTLDNPQNTKISFTPTAAGEISLTLTISDETQAKIERTLSYKVENPRLQVSLANVEDDLTLNERSSFNFGLYKLNYSGKFYYEITGSNCHSLKVANVDYTPGQKIETLTPLGTNVSFIPDKVGRDTVKITIKAYDDWGGMEERKLSFSVTNSDIDLKLDNVESTLFVGRASKFNFTASKSGFTGKLKYEIKTSPSDIGTLKVNGEDYISGHQSIEAGKTIPVIFTPLKEGSVNIKLTVMDDWSGEKSQSFNYTITNTPIIMEISDYVADAVLNTPSLFNVSLSKLYYNGGYNYSIVTTPANAGIIKINDTPYNGGKLPVSDPQNMKVSFTPSIDGEISFAINVTDNIGGKNSKTLTFRAVNNPINLIVNNQETGLTVHQETGFNFAVQKKDYAGKFQFEVVTEPVSAGTIKIGTTEYKGGRMDIANPTNTRINFTPEILGNIKLTVKAYDEFGGSVSKELPYFVANSDFKVIVSNQEKDIYNGQKTTFNLGILKPNYSGKYKYEIIQTPENSGELKVNGTSYISGKADLTSPALTSVEYISHRNGSNVLTVKVYDELGGVAQENVIFNSLSSDIEVNVSNKENELVINTATIFNVTVNKTKYTGTFSYEIEQLPAGSGSLAVDGKEYTGGINPIGNPDNLQISYTPSRDGRISLKLNITDQIGGKHEQLLDFNVVNPEIKIDVANHNPDIQVNTANTFNFAVNKPNYTGKFKFQITQEPANTGTIQINGQTYSGGKLNLADKDNNTVSFTATKPGAVTLKLAIEDEWGKVSTSLINYSVSNTDIKVDITDKEYDLLLSKATHFGFKISKPGYTAGYEVKFTQEPENAGTIKLNNSTYTDGFVSVGADNSVEFIPNTTGAILLKLTIKDQHGAEKEIAINFDVANPEIKLDITNLESELLYNTATNMNIAIDKQYYTGSYEYQIEQLPAASGTLSIDGKSYSGGIAAVTNPHNLQIGFTPTREGQVTLKLKVMDKVGSSAEKLLTFNVTNPELILSVTNHVPDLIVNSETSFNFAISKQNYSGKFKYQIEQTPAGTGSLKVNGSAYSGALMELSSAIGNTVLFTPGKTGSVTLKLTIQDEWGKVKTQQIAYSVSNSDMLVNLSNKEYDLLLNKPTNVSFTVSKPNYSGTFRAKITQEPEDAGTIKLNNSAYIGELVNISANNTIEFTPKKAGAALLKLTVYDELNGEKEVVLNYNVANPVIRLNTTGKEDNLALNSQTSLNVAMSKEYYNGTFDFQIEQLPAASGSILIDGKAYSGGIAPVTNPQNLRIGFTPTREGRVSLKLKISDKVGSSVEQLLDFNVIDAPITLTLNTPANKTLNIGQTGTFTAKAEKANYSDAFHYEITPLPVNAGGITINGKTSLTGTLNPNPATITFSPYKTGTAVFNVKVTDANGKSAEKITSFNVVNSSMTITFQNKEDNIVLNTPTNFVLKVNKPNYPDNRNLTYTILPAYSGTLIVDGKAYTGTGISISYFKLRNGINIQYSPDREGTCSLAFSITDEFGGMETKSLEFNVSNPEMALYLTGVNTGAANEATLGSTYKFYYNITKANYNDDFSYWITLDPQAVGIIGTSDATPRSMSARSGGGVQMETGTIKNNLNGVTTGEIRFTPSNADYLNQEVSVNVTVRDKWNNEKTQKVKFKIVTSAIQVNVNRRTSIDVEVPYTFYFTVNKPNYTGKFKYMITGWADGDKLEISANNSSWTTYAGGKFDLPHKDHTYIRYTPAAINTIPMRLFIYDETNGEAMQELTFDVKAPAVKLKADSYLKGGFEGEYIPFKITATEGKSEAVNLSFSVDNPNFNGELKFNDSPVTATNSRMRAAASLIPVESGKENKLEMMSRSKGMYSATTTGTNKWNQSDNLSTTIEVDESPKYILNVSTIGEGTVEIYPEKAEYETGDVVTLTAIPGTGSKLSGWSGDASGSATSITVTMNSAKNIVASFVKAKVQITMEIPRGHEKVYVTSSEPLPFKLDVQLFIENDIDYDDTMWTINSGSSTSNVGYTPTLNSNEGAVVLSGSCHYTPTGSSQSVVGVVSHDRWDFSGEFNYNGVTYVFTSYYK